MPEQPELLAIFEQIFQTHRQKSVRYFSRRLAKKCSFNSGKDAGYLMILAYWLYVYGEADEALRLCALSHDAPFPGKGIWNVWGSLLRLWGLEAYLLRQRGETQAAEERIAAIDRYERAPIGAWETLPQETIDRREEERRARLTYEQAAEIHNITVVARTPTEACDYRAIALTKLIGLGCTGHYPQLNREKAKVDQTIEEYITFLKQAK